MPRDIKRIMQNVGRMKNNNFDRADLGRIGMIDRGVMRRSRSLRADHKRNIAKQFGYPEVITLTQHYDMAYRNGIASNLSFGIVDDCWRVCPAIFDGDEDAERRDKNPTEFEKAVDEHFSRLKVWRRLKGLDMAQRPMRYGALMYVTSEQDASNVSDELISLPTIDYLIDMRVYHEAQLPVQTAVTDPNNYRYGEPIEYNVRTNVAGSTNEWESAGFSVHYTRVFPYGEGALGGSIYGVPCNEGCFEALMDVMKVRGSSAEGVYQNASNKYVNTLPEGGTIADAVEILESQEDFDNEISRSMVAVGDVRTMQTTTLTNPENTWNLAVNEACAHHRKPMKMAIGNQTGERASTEDIRSWNRVIMDRQQSECNNMIMGLLEDWFDKFNFPKPSNFVNIIWRDLNESTAEQQVELALKRVQTNKGSIDARMRPIYSEAFIQKEAGAPIENVIELDDGGEDE